MDDCGDVIREHLRKQQDYGNAQDKLEKLENTYKDIRARLQKNIQEEDRLHNGKYVFVFKVM